MRTFAMSVAAIALAAAGGVSAQANGNGQGNGEKRGGPPAAAIKGNGNGNGNAKPQAARPDRGSPTARSDRGNRDRPPAARANGNGNSNAVNRSAGVRNGTGNARSRGDGIGNGGIVGDLGRVIGVALNGPESRYGRSGQGLIDGCPPGLAQKRNGCTPPGQARQQRTIFGNRYAPSLFGYGNFGDGRYYYDDGYLLRLGSGGGVAGWLPLLGGALGIGSVWPDTYRSYQAPDYYVDYFNLGGPDGYRYADNVLYRVDPQTAAIQSVAALLTGDEFVVGQPVPRGYDVYNVPYTYRDRYADRPDAYYRYSDGYIYEIDPETQLVAAAIDLLI